MGILFSRNFTLLWQGQLVSQLGNQAFLVAASYFVLVETGSSTLVSVVMIASTLPLVALGPIGGTVADRHSRRAILVWTDACRAAVMIALGVFLWFSPAAAAPHMVLLVAAAAVNGIMGALFAPALHALIPNVVPRESLASANALSQMSSQACVMLGQALGGVLYVAWGPAALLIFDGVSFAYGSLSTSWITVERHTVPESAPVRTALVEYLRQTQQGFTYLRGQPGRMMLLVVFAGVNVAFMPVFVLLPLFVRDVLGRGPDWYGFLLAASGAGALIGSAVAAPLLRRVGQRATPIASCVAGISIAVVLIAAGRPFLSMAAFVAIGALSSIVNVAVVTMFQAAAPEALRGRVMALVLALSSAAVPLGMLVGGVLGDAWRDSIRIVFVGCGVTIGVLAMLAGRSLKPLGQPLPSAVEADSHG